MQTTVIRRRYVSREVMGALAVLFLSLTLSMTSVSRSGAVVVSAKRSLPHSAQSACTTAGLVLWLEHSDSAAGTTRYDLHLTNLSGHSCTLKGYPKVSAVDLAGHVVGFAAQNSQNEHSPKPISISLANNATATSMIAVTSAENFPESLCHLKMAAGLRVTPPNQSATKIVPLPFPECTLKMPQILVAESIQRAPYSG